MAEPRTKRGSKAGQRTTQDQIFVNRSPILDRARRISAYQLDFLSIVDDDGVPRWQRADGSLLPKVLDWLESRSLVCNPMAFVRADVESLEALVPGKAWSGRIVFELIGQGLGGARILGFLKSLNKERLQFCLDGAVSEETAPLFSLPCFAKVDITGRGEADLKDLAVSLKGSPVTTIATSVETREDFETCLRAGFDLFHGGFFRKPAVVTKKSISPNHSLLLDLALHAEREDDIQVVEAIFKKNPDLTFGLFNLVHSAFFRVSGDVTSIRQAIALLGYKDLHKWAALMLFTIDHSDPRSNPLFENVLVRARIMELLAARLRKSGLSDAAYMTGVFSLVPALFDVTIDTIVEKAKFGEDVREALVEREGNLGLILEIVERLEGELYDESEVMAKTLGLDMDFVLSAQSVAIAECAASSTGGTEEFDGIRRSPPRKPNERSAEKRSWFKRLRSLFHLT